MRMLWAGLVAGGVLALGACGSSNNSDLFKGGGASAGAGGSGATSSGGTSASGGSNAGGSNAGGSGNVGATGGSNAGGSGNVGATGGSNAGGSGNVGATGGTGGGDGGPPPITLDNVCSQMAPQVCALKQSCCMKTVGFNQNNCVSNEKSDCETKVAEVKSGKRTFHANLVTACLSAVAPLYNACLFSGDQLAAFRLTINVCDAVFDLVGAGPGTSCSATSDCSSATQAQAYTFCYNGQCTDGEVLGPGADCSTGRLCGPGLYCQVTTGGATCAQAVSVGGNCNQSAVCGLGFYCTQGHCAVAQPGGAQCGSYLHCLSLSCNQGICGPQAPYVDKQACGV